MKPTPTLEDTLALCALAHRGQKDKAGQPYILHPIRVMLSLGADASEDERIVALLHDVVEDTEHTFESLEELGYSSQVLEALGCVTKREGEEYLDFVRCSKWNPIARRVKRADLRDNMDESRIAHITDRDRERIEKYKQACAILEE